MWIMGIHNLYIFCETLGDIKSQFSESMSKEV